MAIMKMKRLRLMLVRSRKEEVLRELAKLGCVEFSELEGELQESGLSDQVKRESSALMALRGKQASLEHAVELLGHAVGGVCPFALKEGVDVYLDVSMQRFETVLPAAGSSNSCVELTCGELEKAACGFRGWGDFCKAWQETEAQ